MLLLLGGEKKVGMELEMKKCINDSKKEKTVQKVEEPIIEEMQNKSYVVKANQVMKT